MDDRERSKGGEIDRKNPNTKIKHLREHYGHAFAPGWDGKRTLGELLKESNASCYTALPYSIAM